MANETKSIQEALLKELVEIHRESLIVQKKNHKALSAIVIVIAGLGLSIVFSIAGL